MPRNAVAPPAQFGAHAVAVAAVVEGVAVEAAVEGVAVEAAVEGVGVAVAAEGVGVAVAAAAAVEAEGEAGVEAKPGLLTVGTMTVDLVSSNQTKAARIFSATCRRSWMATLWKRARQCPTMSPMMTADKNIAPKMSLVE